MGFLTLNNNPPNILWYTTDQQRFDTIGALGNKYVNTPTIDHLVQNGVAFTRAYCQSPVCTPSRSSFMTGMYPSRLHNTRNGNDTFPEYPPLISKLLSSYGYYCGMIGKFHIMSSGYRTEPRIDDGYSFWKFSHAPRDDWSEGHHYADWVKSEGGDLDVLRLSEDGVPTELHQTTWASEMAIEFISENRSKPWLLNVNIYDPHPPFTPPRSYADRFDPKDMPGPYFCDTDLAQQRQLKNINFQGDVQHPDDRDCKSIQARYYAMIAQVDDQLNRILCTLDETGQRQNTVIVFTTDHGEMLGDHGLLEKGCRFYEGLVRVPLIFSFPDQIKAGLISNALVELLDIPATLLDLAGVPVPDYMQGKSLLPILRGKSQPNYHRDFVRCEYFDAIFPGAIHDSSGPLGQVWGPDRERHSDLELTYTRGTFATMYRTDRYKLSVYHGHDLGELYDLKNDPWEFNNLWDEPESQEIKSELISASFDAHVLLTTDVGSKRVAPT